MLIKKILILPRMKIHIFLLSFRELPKLSAHEEEGVHQNPQYTGQHHFHPVPHDHDTCERVVINVSSCFSVTIYQKSMSPLSAPIHLDIKLSLKVSFMENRVIF